MHIKRRDFRNLNDKALRELFKLNPRVFVVDGKKEVVFIAFNPNAKEQIKPSK